MFRFYVNIISMVKTYYVLFDTFKLLKTNDFINDYYKLADKDGNRLKNPAIDKKKIMLLLPIPPDILNNNETNIYVNDQMSIINMMIYEAGIPSLIDVRTAKVVDDGDDHILSVTWKANFKPLIISTMIWIIIGILIFSCFYFLF